MTILYKYMPFIEDYLDNPTIKLSPPILLNDPFESQMVKDVAELMLDYYSDEKHQKVLEKTAILKSDAARIISTGPVQTIKQSGVISLSESSRSLLMWAHYADQHRGIVIGFNDDLIEEEKNITIPDRMIYSPKPIKVNYDTIRFDADETTINNVSLKTTISSLAKKLLTTKSDDWLYEKEHRIIVPIATADNILFKGPSKEADKLINECHMHEDISINLETEEISIPSNLEMTNKLFAELSKNSKVLFLKNINPEKINVVYFGVRAEYWEVKNFVDAIRDNNEQLGHIRLYKYKLCNERFSLIKEEINPFDYIYDI